MRLEPCYRLHDFWVVRPRASDEFCIYVKFSVLLDKYNISFFKNQAFFNFYFSFYSLTLEKLCARIKLAIKKRLIIGAKIKKLIIILLSIILMPTIIACSNNSEENDVNMTVIANSIHNPMK